MDNKDCSDMIEADDSIGRTKRTTRNSGTIVDSSPLPYTTRSSNRAFPVISEDPAQDAASMILSQVDLESYERAVVFDSERILQRHVLPKSFIWNKPRAQLLRTLPRDIEDMPGILYAGDDSPFHDPSTNDGSFGYGMFDMGGLRREEVKGMKVETITSHPRTISGNNDSPRPRSKRKIEDTSDTSKEEREYPLKCFINYQAAARRSDDPGVIELTVKLPPPSIESALLNCQRHGILPRDPWLKHSKESIKKTKMLIAAERAEFSSSMPLYWGKLDKTPYFNPPAFLPDGDDKDMSENDSEKAFQTCLDSVGVTISDKDALYEVSKRRKKRKINCTKLAQSCIRKWRFSVKVGSVSSRYSLIKDRTNGSKPMHLIATFPSYIQTGKSVSIEVAQKMDEESNFYLGSYDCRASAPHASMSYQAMRNKKDNRQKKNINVGRTRPMWSRFNQAGNNKIVCSSDLTGEKLDSSLSKRPLEAEVFVKLNGKLLSVVESRAQKIYSNGLKRNYFLEKVKWKEQDILDAIKRTSDDNRNFSKAIVFPSKKNNATCTLDPEQYLKELIKGIKPQGSKQKKRSIGIRDKALSLPIPMEFGGTAILKHTAPKFSCLPIEDGYIRVICETPGTMQPSSVHELLKSASQKISPKSNLCSICWSSDETYKVLTCIDCGLSAHVDCCADGGEYSTTTSGTPGNPPWRCSICCVTPLFEIEASLSSGSSGSTTEDQTLLPSRKSRRKPRLPTRFVENTQIELNASSRQMNTDTNGSTNININKIRPSPKCALCPHSGGAMSILKCSNGNKWTHEICRVWCSKRKYQDLLPYQSSSVITTSPSKSNNVKRNGIDNGVASIDTRAIAVTSTIKGNNGTSPSPSANGREKTRTNEDKYAINTKVCCLCGRGDTVQCHQNQNQHQNQYRQGLIKCAATGCTVMFHPMCAVLVTKLRIGKQIPTSIVSTTTATRPQMASLPPTTGSTSASLPPTTAASSSPLSPKERVLAAVKSQEQIRNEAIRNDIELCQEYTLDLIEVNYDKIKDEKQDGAFIIRNGSDSDTQVKEMKEKVQEHSIIPVGFCGIHNPKRDVSFYGCTPGAKRMSNMIRVPYQ